MATGGPRRRPARSGRRPDVPAKGAKAPRRDDRSGAARSDRAARPRADERSDDRMPPGPFRLGAVPGATPGKWIDIWKQRMPHNPLELIPLEVVDQRAALREGLVDAAIVRLPIERDDLSVIPLYDETPVAVCSVESALTAADELTLADLAGELVIVPRDDVLGAVVPDAVAPAFAPLATTADAIATAATGTGVVLMPMSLARLHHRKDVDFRPVVDGPLSSVALAWPTDATTPLVETFIGIVRGRTANSSR
ncbi:LysR substrate-binding domain-containing protein [Microbacterium thalli]|uniref:LysR substrate-binding domain-containing protein n=1 Tax=Microbacterium thalli TaxID=3027921 RepID=A0ABT5SK33_9MICO|nr:LysR substrate-binding domain-containing protein [Microbacterium thalli]MDD7963191.1 LysR substrate-binding domain-containing protein [Microbacterium thalli]